MAREMYRCHWRASRIGVCEPKVAPVAACRGAAQHPLPVGYHASLTKTWMHTHALWCVGGWGGTQGGGLDVASPHTHREQRRSCAAMGCPLQGDKPCQAYQTSHSRICGLHMFAC